MEHKKYIGITHFAHHYVSVCLSLIEARIDDTINKWQILRENTSDKQRRYLLDAGFEDIDVYYDNKTKKVNVEPGDHLFYQGKGLFYEHHLLCIAIEGNTVHCIEYGKSKLRLSKALSMLSSATFNPLLLGKLQEGKITFQELINKKAKKRIWPKEFIDANEAIKRAEDRLGTEENETYDILSNNCESFVNSCKCGLNVSLQVNKLHEIGWEAAKVAGLAGSVIMSPLGPSGYASGGVVGVFLGHCLGEAFESCYKHNIPNYKISPTNQITRVLYTKSKGVYISL